MRSNNTLREKKKQRTRLDLIRAARKLFVEKGYDATTVDEIAEEAMVSRSTLFRYFPSKEDLVFLDTADRQAFFKSRLAGRREGVDAFGAVREALLALAAKYMKEREEIVERQKIVYASPSLTMSELTLDQDWEKLIFQTLQTRAVDRSEQWARVLAAAVFGVVRAILREWFAGDGRGDLVAQGRGALDLLADGFGLESVDP